MYVSIYMYIYMCVCTFRERAKEKEGVGDERDAAVLITSPKTPPLRRVLIWKQEIK